MNRLLPRLRAAIVVFACAVGAFAPMLAAASDVAADSATVSPPSRAALLEQSRARSGGFGSYAPGTAFGVGAISTLAPAAASLVFNPPGSQSEFAWEASVTLAALAGGLVGPAIGLASGGRGDMAGRGLVLRSFGVAGMGIGVLGIAAGLAEDSQSSKGPYVALGIGCLGALVFSASALHDLVITPSAVERGRAPRAQLGLRPDGKVAVSVKF